MSSVDTVEAAVAVEDSKTITKEPVKAGIEWVNRYSHEKATLIPRKNKWFKIVDGTEVEIPPAQWTAWGIPVAEPLVKYVDAHGRAEREPPSVEMQFWGAIEKRVADVVGRQARKHFRAQIVLFIASLLLNGFTTYKSREEQTHRERQLEQITDTQTSIKRDLANMLLAVSGELSQEHREQMYTYIGIRTFVNARLIHIDEYLTQVGYTVLSFWRSNLEDDCIFPTTQGIVDPNVQLATNIVRDIQGYIYEAASLDHAKNIRVLERAVNDVDDMLRRLDENLNMDTFTLTEKNNIATWLYEWKHMITVLRQKLKEHILVLSTRNRNPHIVGGSSNIK